MDLIGKDHKKRDCYLDSMECANYDELKYRMFISIESGNMCYAATCAWAIYNNAPEMLRERMRDCIHQLRDMYREYRKGLFEEKFIAA